MRMQNHEVYLPALDKSIPLWCAESGTPGKPE